ncbi:MAG: hypothetical protein RLZZ200_1180 [Pseudomonadota bacterium]|jgi:hypothetical protein
MRFRFAACCGVALSSLSAWACAASGDPGDELKFSGSFRARYEALSGQPRATVKEADQWLSLRTLFDVSYDAGPFRLVGGLQDSRVYLADRSSAISSNDVNAVELVQAYVATSAKDKLGAGSRIDAQAGRFSLNLGSKRLLAADGYRNATNGFTGALGSLRSGSGHSLTTFYALPQTRLPDGLPDVLDNRIQRDRESSATVVYGGLYTTPRRVAGGAVDVMWVGFQERDAPGRATRDRHLKTLDLRWFRDPVPGGWFWEVEAAFQEGRASAGTGSTAAVRQVAADFEHLRVGYQWADGWKTRIGFELDRASGDGGGAKNHRFDTLFGSRGADYAPSGLYNLVGRANIFSPGLRWEAAPTPKAELQVTARALYLASSQDAFSTIGIRDASGQAGSHAGTQIDTRLRYWLLPKRLQLDVGGTLLLKGRFLQDAPGVRQDGDVKFLNLALQAYF